MKTTLTQHEIDILYRIFAEFDQASREAGLPYSLAAGSALGAVRHGGLIPWDDDGDLYALEEDFRPRMLSLWYACNRRGLRIEIHQLYGVPAYGWYKVYWKDIQFPNTDLFLMSRKDHAWKLTNPTAELWWPKESFSHEQWTYRSLVPFGPLMLPLFGNPQEYLAYVYGADWSRVAWDGYDHRNEKMREVRANTRLLMNRTAALPSSQYLTL